MNLRHVLEEKLSKNDEIFCSLEIVSTRKPSGFYQRLLEEMDKYSPLFYALTWLEAVTDSKDYLSVNLAENFPPNTLLHLATNSLKRDEVLDILRKALAVGITNIFALRGDSLSEDGEFKNATELVAFIREQFGDTFCICVAGYPQTHPESPSKQLDLHRLKMKVDAGADFIITQICFESQAIIDFVNDCRRIGIRVPIVPGIFLPTSHESFERMVHACKLHVPVEVKDDFARAKDNGEAVTKCTIDLALRIMRDVIVNGTAHGFHLFTMNRLSSVAEVHRRVEVLKSELGNVRCSKPIDLH